MKASRKPNSTAPRTILRWALASTLVVLGTAHLTFGRQEFQAQVPDWVPLDPDAVVVASGVVELGLGGALVVLPKERRRIGWIVAGFFAAVFPGNVAQWRGHRDGFGLTTDRARFVRLLFQPLLVAAALWSTAEPRR